MSKVISANRLSDGAVVFLAPEDRWVELLPEAETFDGDAAVAAALERAKAAEARNLILDIAIVDVTGSGGNLAPKLLREIIRAAGPTVRLDHGKQARRTQRL